MTTDPNPISSGMGPKLLETINLPGRFVRMVRVENILGVRSTETLRFCYNAAASGNPSWWNDR